jgi:hypothetical protein
MNFGGNTVTRGGAGRSSITGRRKFLTGALGLLSFTARSRANTVKAADHTAFWLWAGVALQASLRDAKDIYVLAGEVSDRGHPLRVISQRSATPRIRSAKVWIVYRAETIVWSQAVLEHVLDRIELWRAAGNDMAGLQIDFDAATKQLENYATFLAQLRQQLDPRYKLSVTGLLDWSAQGDPQALSDLAGTVDELVLQIYQGRKVIPGYERYFPRIDMLNVPFKIGLLQGGPWQAPPGLEDHAFFRGYVVFLVNGVE